MTANAAKPAGFARFLPLLFILAALALFFALGLNRFFSIDTLRDNRAALNQWVAASPARALAIFILAYAGAVAISFPGASILVSANRGRDLRPFLFALDAIAPARHPPPSDTPRRSSTPTRHRSVPCRIESKRHSGAFP